MSNTITDERHDQGLDRDGARSRRHRLRSRHAAIHPHWVSAEGYLNLMSGGDDHRAADNLGASYERLSAVEIYDPDNVFHVNQDIAPANGR